MPDIANDASTTSTITVGGSLSSQLEVVGDHDWVRIVLAEGQKITISLDGITVVDPYVYMRDAAGTLLAENDDINPGLVRDSELVFTAPTAGTYYIDVAAWQPSPNDAEYPGFTGTYQLSVNAWTPPTVWTYSQIANQLTSGYWGGDVHHFNVAQGGTITVNLTALTGAGQGLAREALNLWSDIIGVTFTEVSGAGQIVFDDNESGAFTSDIYSGGITTSAHVNISTQWLTDYGSGLNSYSFQTYIHEIGHALGLGHAGMYNNTADYPTDARYLNDGWPSTVMSYFGENENTYFSNLGFSFGYVNTPMLADIRAMATLYGLSTTTRVGDTTYGFNNTSGRSEYGAAVGSTLVDSTIFDSGGFDTLNYSGYSSNQTINLNPETFSNIGGGVGNLTIAFNTIIENALGGNGNDILIGNAVANVLNGGAGVDTMTGGAGDDTFGGTKADLSGDTITDFAAGDKIVITDASLAGFTYSLNGNTLTFTGGSMTLQGVSGTFTASAAAGGGVQLSLAGAAPSFAGFGTGDLKLAAFGYGASAGGWQSDEHYPRMMADVNGDGRADVIGFGEAGVYVGLANSTGGFAPSFLARTEFGAGASAGGWISDDRYPRMMADVNGDHRADVVGFGENGVFVALGNGDGSFAPSTLAVAQWGAAGSAGGWSSNDRFLRTMADVNGDGRADIVGFGASAVYVSLANANGTFAPAKIASSGDFDSWVSDDRWPRELIDVNGDHREDIVGFGFDGVHVALANADGTFAPAILGSTEFGWGPGAGGWSSNELFHREVGDVNGDGFGDIVGFGANGVYVALATGNGTFAASHLDISAFGYSPSSGGWASQDHFPRHIADVNGDGAADILGFGDAGVYVAYSHGGI